jgi:hypothetical protein
MAEQVLEGTWEEIARQADQFAGKRVRLTVLPAGGAGLTPSRGPLDEAASREELVRALDRIAEMNRHLPVLPDSAFERESIYADDDEG